VTPTPEDPPPFRRVPTVWLLLAALGLMIVAARCGRDVSLGLDPDSGVAKAMDAGAQ
jgi:hypothetical protein